jgi:hypothetical protein
LVEETFSYRIGESLCVAQDLDTTFEHKWKKIENKIIIEIIKLCAILKYLNDIHVPKLLFEVMCDDKNISHRIEYMRRFVQKKNIWEDMHENTIFITELLILALNWCIEP